MRSQNINKWNLRGWKLEPNYSPRTLVGDWYEERRTVSWTLSKIVKLYFLCTRSAFFLLIFFECSAVRIHYQWFIQPNNRQQNIYITLFFFSIQFDRKSIPSLSTYKMDYQNCTSSRDWRTLWSIKCKQEVGVQLLHCFICFRIITQCNVKINFHLAIVRSVNV